MLLNWQKYACIALVSAGALFGSYQYGHMKGSLQERLKIQEEVTNDYIKKTDAVIAQHDAVQSALDAQGKKHAEDMAGLEGSTDGIINGLRADNKRLLVKLRSTPTSEGASTQCISTVDGKAELDPEYARRLIMIAQKGDKWIENLQETVVILQKKLDDKGGHQ